MHVYPLVSTPLDLRRGPVRVPGCPLLASHGVRHSSHRGRAQDGSAPLIFTRLAPRIRAKKKNRSTANERPRNLRQRTNANTNQGSEAVLETRANRLCGIVAKAATESAARLLVWLPLNQKRSQKDVDSRIIRHRRAPLLVQSPATPPPLKDPCSSVPRAGGGSPTRTTPARRAPPRVSSGRRSCARDPARRPSRVAARR